MSSTMNTTQMPTNTYVSPVQGGGPFVNFSAGAAPGAQGIGASLQISHAILVIIGSSMATLFLLGYLFRK
jgi:hypothetical protein